MTAPMKKITMCVIYLIKVKYILYNYTSYKSTWTSLLCHDLKMGVKPAEHKLYINTAELHVLKLKYSLTRVAKGGSIAQQRELFHNGQGRKKKKNCRLITKSPDYQLGWAIMASGS